MVRAKWRKAPCSLTTMPLFVRMDLNEILSFKPEKPTLKRQADGEPIAAGRDSDMRPPPTKTPRGAVGGQDSNGPVDMSSLTDEEKLRILQSLEEDGEEEGEGLDTGTVKRMLLSFEKKVSIITHYWPHIGMYYSSVTYVMIF